MKFVPSTRVRISIGTVLHVIAALVISSIALMCAAQDSFGADAPRLLIVVNEQGIASTTIHVVNPTDGDVLLPDSTGRCGVGFYVCPKIAGRSASVFTTSNSGALPTTYDAALAVYSEFVTPSHARLRLDPCTPVDEAWFFDLIPPGAHGENSGIVVVAVDHDSVVSLGDGVQVSVPLGRAVILSNHSATEHLIVQTGAGKVCTFAYGNVGNGALFAIRAY